MPIGVANRNSVVSMGLPMLPSLAWHKLTGLFAFLRAKGGPADEPRCPFCDQDVTLAEARSPESFLDHVSHDNPGLFLTLSSF